MARKERNKRENVTFALSSHNVFAHSCFAIEKYKNKNK